MKPNEIMESVFEASQNVSDYNWYAGKVLMHSSKERTIKKYLDKDCVVAYYDCEMGNTILIKGKKKYFLLIHHKIPLDTHAFTTTVLSEDNYQTELINNCINIIEEKGRILNEDAFKNYQYKILAKQI